MTVKTREQLFDELFPLVRYELILLVCGGRKFKDRAWAYDELDFIRAYCGIKTVVHGYAEGADTLAEEWAQERGVSTLPFPVSNEEWRLYGKPAGIRRNAAMLKAVPGINLGVAFPGGPGTLDMITRLGKAQIPIYEPEPRGH